MKKLSLCITFLLAFLALGLVSCPAPTTTPTPAPSNYVYFVKQPLADATDPTTATISGGTITVHNNYAAANAFVYSAGPPITNTNNFNGLLSIPTQCSGDFSVKADITITAINKVSSANGIGVGMLTGYANTDSYGYALLRAAAATVPTFNCFYTKNGSVGTSSGGALTGLSLNTSYTLSFRRATIDVAGTPTTTMYWRAYPTGGTIPAESNAGAANFYGCTTNPVYVGVSFANVNATITNLIITDSSGATVFDSSTGSIINYIPAALTLSSNTVVMKLGDADATVTATANAIGGAVAGVTAVAADPTIVGVSTVNGSSNSTITFHGLKGGTTAVTVTNTADTSTATNTKTITVTINDYATSDPYGALTTVYPAVGASAAHTDGELAITFDSAPTLNTGGSIKIFKYSDSAEIDSIGFANETQTVAGVAILVKDQLARVSTNTVYFTPHFGKLAYNTQYYIVIPIAAISGALNGVAFNGFSNLNTVATWRFTTKAAPSLTTTVTVDGSQASSADFRTVGGALMSLAANPIPAATAVTVNVAAGNYIELVNYRAVTYDPTLTITVAGPAGNVQGDSCTVQYVNGGNWNGQNARATFYFAGANLILKNITLKSTGLRAAVGQAETIYFDSRTTYTMAAYNCTFKAYQDTIQTSGKCWFYSCYIEGNTDFIWGIADVTLFQNCTLHVIGETASNTYSIFVARTYSNTGALLTSSSGTIPKGYVLVNSSVIVDSTSICSYGRDAGAGPYYDQVALVNNTFSGSGTLVAGLWVVTTVPTRLGDSTYVGWKAAGNTGLSAETIPTAANTAASINSQTTEYNSIDHILNRVVTVTNGTPDGFTAAASPWDVSSLASAWGAPLTF
jgi:hypothetical protein